MNDHTGDDTGDDERELLRRTVEAILTDHCPPELVGASEGSWSGPLWKRLADAVSFVWHETGSVPGEATTRRGFGTTVLENMVGRSLNGEVEREVHELGIEWRFTIPLSSLDPSDSLNGAAEPAASDK